MGKDYAPLQEHFWEIPQAQFVAHAPEHHEAYHIGGVLKVVEAGTSPLVELPRARMTAKAPVAERSSFPSFVYVSRLTVWTPHHLPLLDANVYTLSLLKGKMG
jgi:hypothetical protein